MCATSSSSPCAHGYVPKPSPVGGEPAATEERPPTPQNYDQWFEQFEAGFVMDWSNGSGPVYAAADVIDGQEPSPAKKKKRRRKKKKLEGDGDGDGAVAAGSPDGG